MNPLSTPTTPSTPPRLPAAPRASGPVRAPHADRKGAITGAMGPESAVPRPPVRSRQVQPRRLDFTAPARPSLFEQEVAVALAHAARGSLPASSLGARVAEAIAREPDPDAVQLDALWSHYCAKGPRLSAEHLQDLAVTLGSHLLMTQPNAAAAMRQAMAGLVDPVAPYLSGRQREAILAGLDRACTAMASLNEARLGEFAEARRVLAGAAAPEHKSPDLPPAATRESPSEAHPVRRAPTRRVPSRSGAQQLLLRRDPTDVLRMALLRGEPRMKAGSLDAHRMWPEAFKQLAQRALLMVSSACVDEIDAAVARCIDQEQAGSTEPAASVETKSGPVRGAGTERSERLAGIQARLDAQQQVALDRAVDRMLRFYSWFVQGQCLDAGCSNESPTPTERTFLSDQVEALESIAPTVTPQDAQVALPHKYVPIAVAVTAALRRALNR